MPNNNDLTQLALAAISRAPTAQEQQAWDNSPNTVPDYYKAFDQQSQQVLANYVQQGGSNSLCSTRLYESANEFNNAVRYIENFSEYLEISDRFCLLLAAGLIPISAVEQAITNNAHSLSPRFINRALIYRLLAENNLEAAMQACANPVMQDEAWVGWRAIGRFHAAQADTKAFFELWANYQARQKQDWMHSIRRTLLRATCHQLGWRRAVKLTGHKQMTAKCHELGALYVALTPIAETGDINQLRQILEQPELVNLSQIARLQLILTALHADSEVPLETDHPDLDAVLTAIIAIDPTISKQQSRQRDHLLIYCWYLMGEERTLKRIRSAIRAPLYRSELKCLAKHGNIG